MPGLLAAIVLSVMGPPVSTPPRRLVDLVFDGQPMRRPLEAAALGEVTGIWAAYGVDVRAAHPGESGRDGAVRLAVVLADRPAASSRRVRIRVLRHGELDTVSEFCARLSARTRYLRFLSPIPVVPESLLHMLADVDDPRRLTLIAELDDAAGGNLIALGLRRPARRTWVGRPWWAAA